MCCLSEQCPISIKYYGEKELCPALKIDIETSCELVRVVGVEALGIGAGCCFKAHAVGNNRMIPFASLSPEVKRKMTGRVIQGKLDLYRR
jgi:hypothetical protein